MHCSTLKVRDNLLNLIWLDYQHKLKITLSLSPQSRFIKNQVSYCYYCMHGDYKSVHQEIDWILLKAHFKYSTIMLTSVQIVICYDVKGLYFVEWKKKWCKIQITLLSIKWMSTNGYYISMILLMKLRNIWNYVYINCTRIYTGTLPHIIPGTMK